MKRFVLSLNQLRGAMPALSLAKASSFLPLIQASLDEFEINDREEVCAYLATLGHESQDLTKWRENMNYSAKRLREVFGKKYFPTAASAQAVAGNPAAIANIVYGGRMGNVHTGDGWRYIARGPIGATGRDMYRAAGKALSLPLEHQPELVEKPEVGFRVSAWIWAVNKRCGSIAKALRGVSDKEEFGLLKEICKRINGGRNGLEDRVKRYERALKAIPITSSLPDVPVSVLPPDYKIGGIGTPQPDPKTETQTPTVEAEAQPDFSKLLKKDAVKQSAKVASVRGVALLWRPIALLITALKAGNWIAISGTVLAALILIAAVVLYHKEIVSFFRWMGHKAIEVFTD